MKGVSPLSNEWQFDHITPNHRGKQIVIPIVKLYLGSIIETSGIVRNIKLVYFFDIVTFVG